MLEKEFIFNLTENLNELKENKINDYLYGVEMTREITKHLGVPYARPIEEDWGFLTHLKEIFPGVHVNMYLVGQPVEQDIKKIDKLSCPLEYRVSIDAQLSLMARFKMMFNKNFEESIGEELEKFEMKLESFLKHKQYDYKAF